MTFSILILALGLILIFEGLGPLFIPTVWKRILAQISEQPPHLLQRVGGCLVTSGVVLLVIFS